MKTYTQQRFADAVIELMKTTPLEKLTVKMICDRSGEHRQTFYYYFQDKYDLITWILYQDAVYTIDENAGLPWDEILTKIFEKLYSRKSFYANALSDHGQNALINDLLEHDIKLYKEILQKKLHTEKLDEELEFSIKYHAYSCVNLTKEWLQSKDDVRPEIIAGRMYKNMPEILKDSVSG